MTNLLASPWIPTAVLVLLALAARLLSRSWLAPSAFVALLWSAFVWISMLAADYPIYASAIWLIVLLVFVLQLGAFIGESIHCERPSRMIREEREASNEGTLNRRVLRCSALLSIIALGGAAYFVFWSLRRFDLPVSLISFFELGHLLSVQYAEYGDIEPWLVRLTIMWVYPAALLGGIAFASAASRKTRLLSLWPFLPSLLVGSIVAARSGVLFSFICWISGYFGLRNWQSNGRYPLFRRRLVLVLAVLGVAVVILFVLVDALRQSGDEQTVELALDSQRFVKYTFGSLSAFSSWFHQYAPGNSALGAYTFGGILELLGMHRREIGLYENFVTLSGGLETNIYTVFRGLIEDFTLAGAVSINLVVGIISGMLLSFPSQKTWTPIVFGSAYYAFILGSPITSIFTYNGLLLAWVIGALVLRSHFRSAGIRISAATWDNPSSAIRIRH